MVPDEWKPPAPAIGANKRDVISISKPDRVVVENAPIVQIANRRDPIHGQGARKLVDLCDQPGIAMRKGLHAAIGNPSQDVLGQVNTAHPVKYARELAMINGVAHARPTTVKSRSVMLAVPPLGARTAASSQ